MLSRPIQTTLPQCFDRALAPNHRMSAKPRWVQLVLGSSPVAPSVVPSTGKQASNSRERPAISLAHAHAAGAIP